jgi:isopenicillin N synthase-like dioxygenase
LRFPISSKTKHGSLNVFIISLQITKNYAMNLTNDGQDPLETLRAQGFLRVALSDAIQRSIQGIFDAGSTFFQQPVEEKALLTVEQDLGYRAFGDEYSISPDFPDQLESFSVSPRLTIPSGSYRSLAAQILYDRMSKTFELFEPIVEDLTITLAKKLTNGRVGEHLKGKLRYWSRLQLNYTQPTRVAFPFINETHDDLDLFTINCASGAGLELRIGDDTFLPVDTGVSEAIIFPGEIAWLLSGGNLRPMYHRVRTHSEIKERMSLLFFADPEPEYCEAWILNAVNDNVDIGEHVRHNVSKFGLKGFKG